MVNSHGALQYKPHMLTCHGYGEKRQLTLLSYVQDAKKSKVSFLFLKLGLPFTEFNLVPYCGEMYLCCYINL